MFIHWLVSLTAGSAARFFAVLSLHGARQGPMAPDGRPAAGGRRQAAGGGRLAAGASGNRNQARAKAARTLKKRAAEELSLRCKGISQCIHVDFELVHNEKVTKGSIRSNIKLVGSRTRIRI